MNTNTVNTVPNLTLTEAVVEAVMELRINGKFSAHDVTKAVRDAANYGEITLPGLEARPNNDGIKYWVNHEDVKRIVDNLEGNGELANLGLTDVDYSGPYRVFVFAGYAAPAVATPATDATVAVATPAAAPTDTESPVSKRIKAYLAGGDATMKQIQSVLKVNGITCKDLATMVADLGYTVTPGTVGCYSTYTAEGK